MHIFHYAGQKHWIKGNKNNIYSNNENIITKKKKEKGGIQNITTDFLEAMTSSADSQFVTEPISMSTPQMNYVNENSQNNMKEQRRDNNNNKWQFICRIYKRVCKCPWRLYVVFS